VDFTGHGSAGDSGDFNLSNIQGKKADPDIVAFLNLLSKYRCHRSHVIFKSCAASNGATIGFGIVVFLFIIVSLIIIIQTAAKKLKPQGNVKIIINGEKDKPIEVAQGDTLLGTLMGANILLPSACGGGGTCAMCKCQIIEGHS